MMAGSVPRGLMVAAAVACLAFHGGCAAFCRDDSEAGDHLYPPGDHVPIESARFATSEDAILWLEKLGFTSEAQPWEARLVARPAGGWAWVVWSTESELADGTLRGLVFRMDAETGKMLRHGPWEAAAGTATSRLTSGSAETAN